MAFTRVCFQTPAQSVYAGRHLLQEDAAPANASFFNISGLLYFYATTLELDLVQVPGGIENGFTKFILPYNKADKAGSKAGNNTGMWVKYECWRSSTSFTSWLSNHPLCFHPMMSLTHKSYNILFLFRKIRTNLPTVKVRFSFAPIIKKGTSILDRALFVFLSWRCNFSIIIF